MAGDNRHVTENFLRLNFSPKPGITPGTNDFILMDCDQITARYYVSIAGVSSTGKRLPSQNQLSDSITLPTVSTGYITAITATTATGSGNVSADGGATVTDRGIQWSTSQYFTTIAGSASGGSGTGSFTANMTGLTAGTTYYVRAYATNSVGTAISYNMPFTTTASCPNPSADNISFPNGHGTNPLLVRTGASAYGCSVLERLIVFGTSPNPTKAGNKVVLANVDGTIDTNFTISGTWYFGSYIRTAGGESYVYYNYALVVT